MINLEPPTPACLLYFLHIGYYVNPWDKIIKMGKNLTKKEPKHLTSIVILSTEQNHRCAKQYSDCGQLVRAGPRLEIKFYCLCLQHTGTPALSQE